MRSRLISAMLLCALLAGVASALPAAAQQVTPEAPPAGSVTGRTNVRYLVPFGPRGLHASLKVISTGPGTCSEASVVLPDRDDAWFCTNDDGGILDPCFQNQWQATDAPGEVACFTSPWDPEVVVLKTHGPLDVRPTPEQDGSPGLPWALELGNGERCGLMRGATAGFAGQRYNYGCEGGGGVIGEVDRSGPVWVVSYLADGALATTLVPVIVAWQ